MAWIPDRPTHYYSARGHPEPRKIRIETGNPTGRARCRETSEARAGTRRQRGQLPGSTRAHRDSWPLGTEHQLGNVGAPISVRRCWASARCCSARKLRGKSSQNGSVLRTLDDLPGGLDHRRIPRKRSRRLPGQWVQLVRVVLRGVPVGHLASFRPRERQGVFSRPAADHSTERPRRNAATYQYRMFALKTTRQSRRHPM